jgi:restriction endonuclease Mrr
MESMQVCMVGVRGIKRAGHATRRSVADHVALDGNAVAPIMVITSPKQARIGPDCTVADIMVLVRSASKRTQPMTKLDRAYLDRPWAIPTTPFAVLATS